MKNKILIYVIMLLCFSSYSQNKKKVCQNVYLIKNEVLEDFKKPDSILFLIQSNLEYDKYVENLSSKIKKFADKSNLKSTTHIETGKHSNYEMIKNNYKQQYVAIIFFGFNQRVEQHSSGDPKNRRVYDEANYQLIDMWSGKILFNKILEIRSIYYSKNSNSLAKAIILELTD